MKRNYFLITTNNQLYFGVAESSAELLWVLAKDKEVLNNIDGENYYFNIDKCEDFDIENGRIENKTVKEYFENINEIRYVKADYDHIAAGLNALDMEMCIK